MTVKVIDPTQTRLLTVEEWLEHPEADRYELIDGVLRARMVNMNYHEFAVIRLGYVLTDHMLRANITGLVLGSNTKYRIRARRGIMPDVSLVLGEKAARVVPNAAFNTIGPNLAVEVLSPDQGEEYLEERLGDFWTLDTTEVWIVEPGTETVTGYERKESKFAVFGVARGDEEFSSRLLPGLCFSVGLLWMTGA